MVFLCQFSFSYQTLLSAVIVAPVANEIKIRARNASSGARIATYSIAGTKNSDVNAPSSLLYFTHPPCSSIIASALRNPNP